MSVCRFCVKGVVSLSCLSFVILTSRKLTDVSLMSEVNLTSVVDLV